MKGGNDRVLEVMAGIGRNFDLLQSKFNKVEMLEMAHALAKDIDNRA